MAYGELIDHVTGDVTWPPKVKLVTPIWWSLFATQAVIYRQANRLTDRFKYN